VQHLGYGRRIGPPVPRRRLDEAAPGTDLLEVPRISRVQQGYTAGHRASGNARGKRPRDMVPSSPSWIHQGGRVDALIELIRNGESYVVLLPIYAGLLIGERMLHELTSDRRWNDRDGAANIAITVAYLVGDVAIGWLLPVAALGWLYDHGRVLTLGFGATGWLAAFLLYDLTWYVDHRLAHRVSALWAFHSVHHSSNEFNTTTASRGFVFDNTLLTRPSFYLLALVGVTPLHFVTIKIVTSVWGIAQHTRLVGRLGPLEWIFATPSNHRVHHGADAKYLDKNYGEVLIVWDRLFGTYQVEEEEPRYGLVKEDSSCNPLWIEVAGLVWLARGLRALRTPAARLRALFGPPEALIVTADPARSGASTEPRAMPAPRGATKGA